MPSDVVCRGHQYERALRDLIIMMAPVVPHFACELWERLVKTPGNMSQDIDWVFFLFLLAFLFCSYSFLVLFEMIVPIFFFINRAKMC